tara:strand:- start:10930 stop:12765 length:1836 start_codon:yes stop_codon:yes gene_type:complete
MPALNYTSAYFSLQPKSYNSANLNFSSAYDIFGADNGTGSQLLSCNSPIIYQFLWLNGPMTEADQGTGSSGERVAGDLVNVYFDIYAVGGNELVDTTWPTNWEKIATIRKTRDMRTLDPSPGNNNPFLGPAHNGHRFTVDISQIVADLLSYSLVPINGGAWGVHNDGTTGPGPYNTNPQVAKYGGLNGQWKYENVHTQGGVISNATLNGVSRGVRVNARLEILQADGTIDTPSSGVTEVTGGPYYTVINSAPQWSDKFNLTEYVMNQYDTTPDRKFLSVCPNGADNVDPVNYMPQVRLTDQAQWLYGFLHNTVHNSGADYTSGIALKVEVSDDGSTIARSCYLVDFSVGSRLRRSTIVQYLSNYIFAKSQHRTFAQNVSPAYINQHNNGDNPEFYNTSYTASMITSSTQWYRVSLHQQYNGNASVRRTSEYRYYKMNSDFEDVYGFVRFHWLNRMGGIDSYTAKRNVTESINISKETIKRKDNVRQWQRDVPYNGTVGNFDDSIYGNMYTFGRETLNVDANKNYTVYTDPLPIVEARWLEELFTSPNVWIEKETEGSEQLNALEPNSRPSTLGYWPILITNTDITEVSEEDGLVQIQIEYTDSHSVNTQRT